MAVAYFGKSKARDLKTNVKMHELDMQPCQCLHVAALSRHDQQQLAMSSPMRLFYDSAVVAAAVPLMHRLRSAQPLRVPTQDRAVCNRMFLEGRCASRRLCQSFRNRPVPTSPSREERHGSLHAVNCFHGNGWLVSGLLRATARSCEAQACVLSARADLTWRRPAVSPATLFRVAQLPRGSLKPH